ncbi:hypothetical protein ES703_69435 [subsurface metagenome]
MKIEFTPPLEPEIIKISWIDIIHNIKILKEYLGKQLKSAQLMF